MEKDQNISSKIQNDEPENINNNDQNADTGQNTSENTDVTKDVTPEEKILELEDKLARTFAEMENQRRRFEKERDRKSVV